ncbi:MAG: type II toxin-antitoxin system death-on-curing family toxin [Acidimicrobiaceae bacterium]
MSNWVIDDKISYLTLEDVLSLAVIAVNGEPLVRDLGLLGSAIARPRTALSGVDIYPDLISKAAAMLQSLINNHALVDGNKRLAWLSVAVFLQINEVSVLNIASRDVVKFVNWVGSMNPDIEQITARLKRLVK